MLDCDLHCHSNISDGMLPPAELVARAAGRGVKFMALTDHDDVRGLPEAARVATEHGVAFINGVEISVTWHGHNVHIVGLNINPENAALQAGLKELRAGRAVRAQLMADSLAKAGISGSLEGAYKYAVNPEIIGRTHFARFLVDSGHAKDVRSVFKHFLVKGKPGYVSHQWAELKDAVGWITGSGGIAVIAHPGRYLAGRKPMGRPTLKKLIAEFVEYGGRGIEVVTGSHTPEQFAEFARYASEFGLLSSCGSDFHAPDESFRDLGRLPDLPLECKPVWQAWNMELHSEAANSEQ